MPILRAAPPVDGVLETGTVPPDGVPDEGDELIDGTEEVAGATEIDGVAKIVGVPVDGVWMQHAWNNCKNSCRRSVRS